MEGESREQLLSRAPIFLAWEQFKVVRFLAALVSDNMIKGRGLQDASEVEIRWFIETLESKVIESGYVLPAEFEGLVECKRKLADWSASWKLKSSVS